MSAMNKTWDVFISHASEDKDKLVRPLSESLRSFGVSVWYDEFSLLPGDSLSRSIDKGLAESKHGIVVISHNFIKKPWTEYELRGLVTREIEEDKVIIPIWLGITRSEVISFSPPLADKIAIISDGLTAEDISFQLLRVVRPDIYKARSRAELHSIANRDAISNLQFELERAKEELDEAKEILSEYQCPVCEAELVSKIDAPADEEEKHWGVRETYECGHQCFDGVTEQMCPSDPKFPKFEEYELQFVGLKDMPLFKWQCIALPKTESARKYRFYSGYGHSQEEAKKKAFEEYSKHSARKYA